MAKNQAPDQLLPTVERMGSWVRGPARLERGRIVMDFSKREKYSPTLYSSLAPALAGVRDAATAVRFVERFGLLQHGPIDCDDEYLDGVPRELIPKEVSEPLARLIEAGESVRQVADTMRGLQDAIDGDDVALRRLRSWADTAWQLTQGELRELFGDAPNVWLKHLAYLKQRRHRLDDLSFLREVEVWLADQIENGLKGTHLWVEGGFLSTLPLGTFRWAIGGANVLLHFVFFQFGELLMRGDRIEQCAECRDFFVIHDQRQRFCTKVCGTRARVRQFREGPRKRRPRLKRGGRK